jgi:hypothetical protein
LNWKISVKNKNGHRLLTFPNGQRPQYVTLNHYGIEDLVSAMLGDSQCRGIIFDAITDERFTPALQDAMIRKLCCEENQEKVLAELVKVGFKPVIIREELVVG